MNEPPEHGGHVHLIAICGVGMAALAGLLQSRGYRVTGSDEGVYPPMSTFLESLGIPVSSGYDATRLDPKPDLVVVGNAVSRDNPEARAVLQRGIPSCSFPQALRRFLISGKRSLVVAGTHGKTSTSSLMAWTLHEAGWDPSYFIGGLPINFSSGFHVGGGPWAVVEGDEYDSAFFDKGPKFLHYAAENVILTSLEFDHADIYTDLNQLKGAFVRLMEGLPRTGFVLASRGYPAVGEVARSAPCRVAFYGEGDGAAWTAANLHMEQGRVRFEVLYKGGVEESLTLSQAGRHNVENALAVYGMCRELGIDGNTVRQALGAFAGVRRRQEFKGEVGGVTLVDDFAHHPTAIRETVAAVRMAYPGRRLWAVFEPRSQTSRRKIFEREFSESLAMADRVIVAGLYHPEKIPESERLSPAAVAGAICRLAGDDRALFIENADDIAGHVAAEAREGDIVLVMSNGGFERVQDKILSLLRRRVAARGSSRS